jgi:hypothetical protein
VAGIRHLSAFLEYLSPDLLPILGAIFLHLRGSLQWSRFAARWAFSTSALFGWRWLHFLGAAVEPTARLTCYR